MKPIRSGAGAPRSGPGQPAGEPLRADDDSGIARFCEALLLEDGLSANTLSAYRRDLEGLSRWLAAGGRGPLALAGTGELQAYIAFRFPASKASSGNRRLTVFRRFFRYQVRQGRRADDPTLPVRSARQPLRFPKTLSEQQVESLLKAPDPDTALAIKVITRRGSERLCRYGLQMAREQGRKRVTAVHKANIMKLCDGMFLEEFYKDAAEYPDIKADDIIVDNCCMQLVTRPEQFDVLVTENLYGDIVSDLCAGLVGGLGLAPGANIGEHCAVFEAVHGSAPDIAGKGTANPTALLLSSVMMLHHMGRHEQAGKILAAVLKVCADGTLTTRDLGGTASTEEYKQELIRLAS